MIYVKIVIVLPNGGVCKCYIYIYIMYEIIYEKGSIPSIILLLNSCRGIRAAILNPKNQKHLQNWQTWWPQEKNLPYY